MLLGDVNNVVQIGSAVAAVVAALCGWVVRLNVLNARLEGRVKALEDARDQDLREIRRIADTNEKMLIQITEVKTEIQYLRAGLGVN